MHKSSVVDVQYPIQ